jgi:predicted transposase YdaD
MDEREQWMIGSAARELFAQGEAIGEQRGEERGEVKGQAKALLLVLERRYGPLPSDLRRRVSEAKAAQLEVWLERAADGATLDAIFGAPSKH